MPSVLAKTIQYMDKRFFAAVGAMMDAETYSEMLAAKLFADNIQFMENLTEEEVQKLEDEEDIAHLTTLYK